MAEVEGTAAEVKRATGDGGGALEIGRDWRLLTWGGGCWARGLTVTVGRGGGRGSSGREGPNPPALSLPRVSGRWFRTFHVAIWGGGEVVELRPVPSSWIPALMDGGSPQFPPIPFHFSPLELA